MTDGTRRDVEHMLVHNLKTPLTGLMATLEMLGDGDFGAVSEKQREAVDAMRERGEEMIELLDELLEVWRLDTPGVRVHAVPVAVGALLGEVEAEWSPRFAGRLSLAMDEGLPDAMGDALVLRRVLGNLLLNAMVHGGEDVRVRISARSSGDVVHVDVADDGPGIAEADAERVFDMFVRVERPGAPPARRGSGLGLAYCRAAMLAQGGHIAVRDTGERGASFRLSLRTSATVPGQQPR